MKYFTKLKTNLLVIGSLLFSIGSFAQTITTTTVVGVPYCAGSVTPGTVSFTITGIFNPGNVFSAQLSDASGSFATPSVIGTFVSTAAGTITTPVPAGLPAGSAYRVRVVSSNPVTIGSDNGVDLSVVPAAGAPGTFGNGFWQVDCYSGTNFGNYTGFYTENTLNFVSSTRWGVALSPFSANAATGLAYNGCFIANDQHSYSYKRRNYACGFYQINIPNHDDRVDLFINGVNVYTNTGCCAARLNVWQGILDPSAQIEITCREGIGSSRLEFALLSLASSAPTTVAATNAANQCTSFNANWQSFGSVDGYILDVATDASFTSILPAYNGIDIGNVQTYPITGLSPNTTYFYRVSAYSTSCGLSSGLSNVTSYTTTALPVVVVTPSTLDDCSGVTRTFVASGANTYVWNPSPDLNTTTGATVLATATATNTYTVTGTNTTTGCANTASATFNVVPPSGVNGVVGNGTWHVSSYDDPAYSNYYGFYTEDNLSFNTTTRWVASPSSANASSGLAYSGCTIANTSFSMRFLRTNVPCGIYQLDIPAHDDDVLFYINGTLVYSHIGCCDAHTNVWNGFIDPSMTLELRSRNGTGPGYLTVNFVPIASTAPTILAPTNAANRCVSFNAQFNHPGATGFLLDVATDAAFTSIVPGYSGLDVGNVNSYLVSGLSATTTYFYRVRSYSTPCALVSNYSATQSYTTATPPVVTVTGNSSVCQGYPVTLTGAGATTYAWSPAAGLSAATGTSVVATPVATTVYTVTGTVTATGCTATANTTVTITPSVGSPGPFGNGFWNVYAYRRLTGVNYYHGSYTENNLSFNTTTRWPGSGGSQTPSNANAASGLAYSGCPIPITDHYYEYKRTNFPCGIYRIDIASHDDDINVLLNGAPLFTHIGCCDAHNNIYTGYLDAASTIEVNVRQGVGGSYAAVNVTLLTGPPSLAPSGSVSCTDFNANWTLVTGATAYELDVSTSSTFASFVPGYNALNVGNVSSHYITGLTAGTIYYYRVRAIGPCGTSGNSATITASLVQVAVTPTTATVCQNATQQLTATTGLSTYSWSPAAGLSSSTASNPTATVTADIVYTVTATSNAGCVSTANSTLTMQIPPGTAGTIGNGFWHVTVYGESNYSTYFGSYTENNLNFNTTTRWPNNGTPSSANAASGLAYTGCVVPVDAHSLRYIRTNFPCGTYQFDIANNDDACEFRINGTVVFSRGVSGAAATMWTGTLGPTSVVEFRYRETGGTSRAQISVVFTAPSAGTTNWIGVTSSNWFDANNWCGGVPNSTLSAVIPAAAGTPFQPIISGSNASVLNLSLAATATLSISGGETLSVFGNWTNNGTFSSPTGTVSFEGTTLTTVSGVTSTVFGNIVVNKAITGVGVQLNSPTSFNGTLSLTNSLIATSALNMLTMNASGSAGLGSSASYVLGPMNAIVASTGPSNVNLPIGSVSGYNAVQMIGLTHTNATPVIYSAAIVNASAEALGFAKPVSIDNVSNLRYWQFSRSPVANMGSTQMTFHYGAHDIANQPVLLTVASNNAGISWNDLLGSAVGAPSGSVTTSVPVTVFDRFSLAASTGSTGNPLPVTWLSFTALNKSGLGLLNWETAYEFNNLFFVIERSSNGVHFDSIGSIYPEGDRTRGGRYSFIDSLAGTSEVLYYRIRQVDRDGQFSYSAIRVLTDNTFNGQLFEVMLNPNPVSGPDYDVDLYLTGLELNQNVDYVLTDALGNTIRNGFIPTKEAQWSGSFDLSNLPASTYFITFCQSGQCRVVRVVILK